eukprot:jgi/Galph1/248/GphlegSOOS_G4937.1
MSGWLGTRAIRTVIGTSSSRQQFLRNINWWLLKQDTLIEKNKQITWFQPTNYFGTTTESNERESKENVGNKESRKETASSTTESSSNNTKEQTNEEKPTEKTTHTADMGIDLNAEDLVQRIKEQEEQIDKLKDLSLRAYAEMENVRRITQRDVENSRKYSIGAFAKDLLDVADNLERAINNIPAEKLDPSKGDPIIIGLYEGVKATNDLLQKVFNRHGIERYDPMGEKFDPNYHQAMFEIEDKEKESGIILSVAKTGYKIQDRILRPAEVDLLWTSRQAQVANGLKHGDYGRYRLYCTRRLHRLRKALKLTHGRGKFTKRKLGEEELLSKGDTRILLLLLFQAERAWSHAMELKDEEALLRESKKRSKSSTVRRRQWPRRRLIKAALWATRLERLCTAALVDVKTCLEAKAYTAWMMGALLLERKRWKEAKESSLKAKIILQKLEQTPHISAQQKRTYEHYMEEVATCIRYVNYQLSRKMSSQEMKDSMDSSAVEDETVFMNGLQSQLEQSQPTNENMLVEWCGHVVPVIHERIREYLIHISSLVKTIEETEDKMVDNLGKIVALYTSCINIVSKELQQGELDNEIEKELNLLKAYLVGNRLQYVIQKNIFKWKSWEEKKVSNRKVIPLVENCMKICQAIRQLEGVQENVVVQNRWLSEELAFRVVRCYYLSKYYFNKHSWAEAYVLSKNANDLMHQISFEELRSSPWLVDKLANLKKELISQSCLAKAYGFLEENKLSNEMQEGLQLNDEARASFKTPLMNRLDTVVFPESLVDIKDLKIIEMKPNFMTAQCKPFLFDLAAEELAFPDLSLLNNTETEEKQEVSKPGLLGKAVRWFSSKK